MSIRQILMAQTLAAALALGAALVFQYAVHLPPCHFCLLQRYPYVAVLVLGVLSWFRPCRLKGWLNAGLFLASGALAAWHSGLERGWWTSGSGCTSAVGGSTPAEVLASLMAAPVVRCDEMPWSIAGLSLANLNIIYGVGVAAVSVWMLLWKHKP
jgi:disulfide bond formation protein DsbB